MVSLPAQALAAKVAAASRNLAARKPKVRVAAKAAARPVAKPDKALVPQAAAAASRNLAAHKPRAVVSKAASRNRVAHQSKVLAVASRNLVAHKPRVVVNKAVSRAANKVVVSRNLAADKPKVRGVAKVAAQPVDKAAKAVVANKVVGRVAVKPVEQLVGPAVEQLAVRQTVRGGQGGQGQAK